MITKVNEEERVSVLRELDKEFKTKIKSVSSDEAIQKIKDSFAEVKKEIGSIRVGTVLDENAHHKFSIKYGSIFESDIGAEAIYKMFKEIDLVKLRSELIERIETVNTSDRVKMQKRLNLLSYMIKSVKAEWMFLKAIPIIPPTLTDGCSRRGRHATSM